MKKLFLIFTLYILSATPSLSQIDMEFLVTVERGSGQWDIVDSIPEIRWIDGRYAYDSFNHRYFCLCGDDASDWHLFSIDRYTAATLHAPMIADYGQYGESLTYNNADQTLYGLKALAGGGGVEFGSMAIETGNWNVISTIGAVGDLVDSRFTIDEQSGYYMFYAKDQNGDYHFFVIDLTNGSVVSQSALPLQYFAGYPEWVSFDFNNQNQLLYVLKHTNSGNAAFGTLDPITVTFNLIAELTDVQVIFQSVYQAIDSFHDQYVFFSINNIWGEDRLCTLDLTNGVIVSSTPFPIGLDDPGENVTQLVIDQEDGELLAMHWEFNHMPEGCTEPCACNYNPGAISDDGSCEYLSCVGCTGLLACNYNAMATIEDGSCEYTSCAGCTSECACNYNPDANLDDGSCEYLTCAGCTGLLACNYNTSATLDDGSCEYVTCAGCTYFGAPEYNASATIDDGSCSCDGTDCVGDLNDDELVNTTDLLIFLSLFGTSCP